MFGPDLVYQAMEKVKVIWDRIKVAQSCKKSSVDVRYRDLEFEIRDKVFLKVSLMKEVMQFGKKGKLSPRFIGPYVILQRVGNMAYELDLPSGLSFIHPVFHVSMLRKCLSNPSLVVPLEGLGISNSLSYEKVPVEILDR